MSHSPSLLTFLPYNFAIFGDANSHYCGGFPQKPCGHWDLTASPLLATLVPFIAASGELFWIDFSQYCTYLFYVSKLTQEHRDGLPQSSGLQSFQGHQ